jgi:homoserine dehydrogenase
MDERPCTLALLGFGNVGRALARLLLAKRAELLQRYGLACRVIGIATGRHGTAIDPEGIDLEQALALTDTGQSLVELTTSPQPGSSLAFIESCRAEVLIETTPVNYATGQPAVDFLRAALNAGMHAITANKGPVVHAYRELRDLARMRGRGFYFESAVMDGAPVFSLWRQTLPAARLLSFRGILNSTTNLILTLMEEGESFEDALAQAQSMGIAETDPSGDVLGWDAAVKVAALATVLMEAPLLPDQVNRQGIERLTSEHIAAARRQGRRWKLICQAGWDGDRLRASVAPELIEADDPLYNIAGTSSAVTFHADVLSGLTIVESDPGPETTAYGLLADLLHALAGAAV